MSLFKRINWDKHCFMYCGAERCDCGASATRSEFLEHEEKNKLDNMLQAAKEKNKGRTDE